MAAGVVTKGFKSPARALVRSFRLSRDRWKQKYMSLQKMNKTLKVRVSDVEKSRLRWREEAESQKSETQRMVEEVERLRARVQGDSEPTLKTAHRPR